MNNLRETEQQFLDYILRIIWQDRRNTQIIYPIFQDNLDKLTVDFAQRLRYWGELQIRHSSSENSESIATLLYWFSNLILDFPLGYKTANIAIAKAGYECALIFYNRERHPFVWAEITINLGIAYEEDPQADPVQKWEDAINCYQKSSQIFTRTTNPERWASIQDNLGNAYRNRLLGEDAENLQQSISYHQKALQIFTPENYPKQWGVNQHNLGQSYFKLASLDSDKSHQDPEQCLETAINYYEQSLQIKKKDVYPDSWAMTQLSLGNAYSVRLRGNPYENHEKAQQYYENALSVYTPATNPYYYQQVKGGQERLNQLKTNSNRETQQESSFIIQVLKLTSASQRDVQKVFPFLEKNLDKFNQNLIQELREFMASLEEQNHPATTYKAMMGLYFLSHSLMIFPQGNREINLDIAIAGWQMVLRFFKDQPQNIILKNIIVDIQIRLGFAFHEKYENNLGNLYINLEETIKCFEEALTLDQSQNSLDRETLADIQDRLGLAYFNKNKIKADPNNIEKAISAYESALKYLPEDSLDWARVQNNLGWAYYDREGNNLINLNAAIKCYEKAESIRKQDTHSTEWADVQISLSSAYYYKGILGHPGSKEDIEKAIKYAENAEKVYNDSNKSKYPQRWALVKFRLGIAYSDNRKDNHAENIDTAINYLTQALDVWTQQDYPYDSAQTKQALGVVYFQKSLAGRGDQIANLKLSVKYLEEALKSFEEKHPVDYAETQRYLAETYRNLAKYIEPVENLKKALTIANSAVNILINNRQHNTLSKTYQELATCYKNMGAFVENTKENLIKAIECYQNALALISRETHPFDWGNIKNSLGNAYKHNGQYQEAIKCFEDTLQLHTRKALSTDYIKTLFNLGNTHTKFNKLTEAFNIYKEAIDTLEDDLIDKLKADDDAKRKLGEEWFKIYQYMIAVCLKLGKQNSKYSKYYATAWEYAERSKARRLVELFGQTKPDDVSDEIWKEFQDLRNKITNEQKWIEDQEKLIILSEESLSQYPELDTKKANLTNLKQQLNQKLNDYPRLAATQRVQYTPFSKIGEKLSDDHTVIIQWYLLEADQKFCAFIYTRQSSQPYVWESSLEDFEKLQQWYQKYFVNYISDFSAWSNKLSKRIERLAEILHIDELLNYLPPKCQQVILIPHRYLHLLPIHALPIKPETWQKFNPNSAPNQDNYLFECFTKGVRYAPSCQTLLMLEKRSRPNFNQLFAMGNPTEDRAFTALCVETIETFWKQKYPQSETKVLCGEQATKNSLVHELKDYLKNAHTFLYSGHGSFEFESPLDSGLILHEKKCLQLTEIFGLNLEQCRLVTLIGCETGMTDWTSITDEYIGLPSAFLWAGVSGIVSSLWTVEEKASVFLGIKLYQNLLAQSEGEKNVIQALREAQNWLRDVNKNQLKKWIQDSGFNVDITDWLKTQNKQPFSSPYYWAAFCVIGK